MKIKIKQSYYNKKINAIKEYYPYIGILCIAVIYCVFKIRIHTYESYLYVANAEGFWNFLYEHSPHNPLIYTLPDFNNYHPYHPLLHFFVFIIYNFFHLFLIKINTLSLVQNINIIFGIITLIICYKISIQLLKSKILSLFTVIAYAFTNIHWYQSQSGEVYIIPLFFLLLSLYLLMLLPNKFKSQTRNYDYIILSAISLGLAIGFHLLTAAFVIICIVYLFHLRKISNNYNYIKAISIFTGINLFIFFLVYIMPFVFIINVNSFKSYFNMMNLYVNIFGFWSNLNEKATLSYYLSDSLTSVHNFVKSIFIDRYTPEFFSRIIFIVFLVFSIVVFKKIKNFLIKLLTAWIWFFFLLITFVLSLSGVNDYWIYIAFPFVLFFTFLLNNYCRPIISTIIMLILSLSLFSFNFYYDIYPKSSIDENKIYILSRLDNQLFQYKNFVMFMDRGEIMVPEFWYLGHKRDDIELDYIFSRDVYLRDIVGPRFKKDLKNLVDKINNCCSEFIFIGDKNLKGIKTAVKQFHDIGFKSKELYNYSDVMDTKYIKRSCFDYNPQNLNRNIIIFLFKKYTIQ